MVDKLTSLMLMLWNPLIFISLLRNRPRIGAAVIPSQNGVELLATRRNLDDPPPLLTKLLRRDEAMRSRLQETRWVSAGQLF